jgi:cystathionine gamma-synthase
MYPLGVPLPDSPHAVSVSLPKWADVVGYEKGESRVIEAMQLGYPRFVYHPFVAKLFADCAKRFAGADEFCHAYPSRKTCELSIEYCGVGRVEAFSSAIWVAVFPRGSEKQAKEFWQHAGVGICSRFAEHREAKTQDAEAVSFIKDKLANLSGADAEDMYLFPSGMAAIYTAHRLLETRNPKPETIQLGFPYVDTLRVQQKFGTVEFMAFDDHEKLAQTQSDAVFTEYPLNPLLQRVDFAKVRAAIGTTPLIVDDTLCAWQGFNTLDVADIAVTSLTKFFSGIGDVMAGSLILNKKSLHYANFKEKLDGIYEDSLYADDAKTLAQNCTDFDERIGKIVVNAGRITNFLKTQSPQSIIHNFNGMISVVFPTSEQAVIFYDNLQVMKGPSLGTEYTLACPYTLLAHYNELDWAESVGVPAHLVRISVGTEDYAELEKVFEKALSSTLR